LLLQQNHEHHALIKDGSENIIQRTKKKKRVKNIIW
jgi:hypothetical protein